MPSSDGPRVIPVSRAGRAALVSAAGHPAWPIASELELDSVRRFAARYGAGLEWVEAQPAGEPEGRDAVAILSPEVAREGRLYAHLTRRRAVIVDGPAAAADDPAVKVMVAPRADYPLLEAASRRAASGSAVGLIVAQDPEARLRQALTRAAALRLSPLRRHDLVEVTPEAGIDQVRSGSQELFGGAAGREPLREAVGRGASVLAITTHSDGVDAFLGRNAVLCSLAGRPLGPAGERPPLCLVTGTCHRGGGEPVQEAIRSPGKLSPDEVRAFVVWLNICYGFMLPSGHVAPDWSLLERLLDNPEIGALVTSFEIVFVQPVDFEASLGLLREGEALGRSLSRYLEEPGVRERGVRLVLAGDPDLRLVPEEAPAPARLPAEECPAQWLGADAQAQLWFLFAYLASVRGQGGSEEQVELHWTR